MSGESALRATPSVNIEEFERRLRATGSLGAAHEDPLAELARLLGAEEPPPAAPVQAPAALSEPDPEPVAPSPPPPVSAAAPTPPPLRAAPRIDNSFGRVVNVDFGGLAPSPPPEPPPLIVEPPPFVETPAEPPPLLRAPSAARLADEAPPRGKVWPVAALVVIGVAAGAGAWAYRGGVPGLVAKTPPLIMAAAGPTKVQPPSQDTVSSPNDIASMIAKDQTSRPTAGNVVSHEEQPVDLNERAKAQAAADARAAAPPANPPTIAAAPLVVVSAPSPTAPSAPTPASTNTAAAPALVPAADAQPASPPASQSSPAAASPAPPARSLASAAASPSPVAPADPAPIAPGAGTVGPTAAPPAPPTPFPEPKRVKTVSVRPDGSFIAAPAQQDQTVGASPSSASQALEPPTLPVDPPTPVPRPAIDPSSAEPATPKLDLPTKLSGKTTTRVPIAKIDTTAATTGQSPEAPLQAAPTTQESKPKRHDPVHVAAADSPPAAPAPDPAPATQAAPSQEEKPSGPASFFSALGDAARGLAGGGQESSAAAVPTRTASAAPQATAPAPVDAGGAYAVQLAAPGSEAEAQSIATRLQSKYAAELDGLQPAIHKAALKDKTVYRVRIQRLTRSAAVSLCEKLKAAGGACFLARE